MICALHRQAYHVSSLTKPCAASAISFFSIQTIILLGNNISLHAEFPFNSSKRSWHSPTSRYHFANFTILSPPNRCILHTFILFMSGVRFIVFTEYTVTFEELSELL